MSNGKRFTLLLCTGCGGIFGYRLDGGCTCEPSHAKTGKNLEFMEVSEHNADLEALAQELERRAELAEKIATAYLDQGVSEDEGQVVAALASQACWHVATQLVRAKIEEGEARG